MTSSALDKLKGIEVQVKHILGYKVLTFEISESIMTKLEFPARDIKSVMEQKGFRLGRNFRSWRREDTGASVIEQHILVRKKRKADAIKAYRKK